MTIDIELCSHVCPRCGSCDRCCDGQCRSSDDRASVDELLGADPEWCGGLTVDEYMDRARRRSSDESEQR